MSLPSVSIQWIWYQPVIWIWICRIHKFWVSLLFIRNYLYESGSRSESFHQQANKLLDFLQFCYFMITYNLRRPDVKVPSVGKKLEERKDFLASWKSLNIRAGWGSGSMILVPTQLPSKWFLTGLHNFSHLNTACTRWKPSCGDWIVLR